MSLNAPEVELWVRDTGMGIDAELLPRLFEPFSQADRTLHRASGGLGLGLALVKGLVELHGGRVEASSEGPGRGAEFVVRLPTVPEPAALSVATVVTQPSSPPVRVLVIEDNRDAADSLRMLLEVIGHEVRVAYSGPDGLAEAVAWQPDVVLSDIGLPGQDGFEVARALRANTRTRGVLLVAVTGYGDQETRKRAQDVGFDHLLTKPADPTTLIQLLSSPR
jgi:two-component system CheB/CheR fusion protein